MTQRRESANVILTDQDEHNINSTVLDDGINESCNGQASSVKGLSNYGGEFKVTMMSGQNYDLIS